MARNIFSSFPHFLSNPFQVFNLSPCYWHFSWTRQFKETNWSTLRHHTIYYTSLRSIGTPHSPHKNTHDTSFTRVHLEPHVTPSLLPLYNASSISSFNDSISLFFLYNYHHKLWQKNCHHNIIIIIITFFFSNHLHTTHVYTLDFSTSLVSLPLCFLSSSFVFNYGSFGFSRKCCCFSFSHWQAIAALQKRPSSSCWVSLFLPFLISLHWIFNSNFSFML